jgi:CBS domain-containing protein
MTNISIKNPIAERITDFLKKYHPFSSIEYVDLLNIAKNSRVQYLDKNEILFKINDKTHDYFYVIADGAVGLSLNSDADEVLIDKCDEGDIIGLRPFFAKDNYLMTAKAREESILYAIPIESFKSIVTSNTLVLNFVLQSFASNTRNPYDKSHKGKLLSENIIHDDKSTDIQSFQPIKHTTNPVTASPNDIVKFVAQTMSTRKIGCVIIQENKFPIGIITDKDLRSKIATGLYSIEVTVDKIMSIPVITVSENLSIAEVQIIMLKHNVGHLCVTKDGTVHSEIIGIISEHDIVVAQANNPGVLLREAKRAKKTSQLKLIREKIVDLIQNSLDKNIPINHISSIVAEINIAITKKAIELAIEKMDTPPPARYAWINIGSQGRKEQLLLTDQDNALVFEDVSDDKYDDVKKYFLEIGEKVTKKLNKIGYSYCEAQMMASNPIWCKSLSDWNSQFKSWINTPGDKGILINTIFFDYDFIHGDEKLIDVLTETIFNESKNNEIFYAYLGADALKNPAPLGFFRQFLVESDGEHKDNFDIKSRAILSLVDAARLLILSYGVRNINNTSNRFLKLAELDPKNAIIYEACAEAFLVLLKFRTEKGLKNNTDGRYLDLNELSKLDKVKLKNTFLPINEIQDIIKNKFKLTYFT